MVKTSISISGEVDVIFMDGMTGNISALPLNIISSSHSLLSGRGEEYGMGEKSEDDWKEG